MLALACEAYVLAFIVGFNAYGLYRVVRWVAS